MAKRTFPWRDGRSLAQVLADSRRWLQLRRIISKAGGCRESALQAAEKRLGQPLPLEVREFLLAVQPIAMFRDGKMNDNGPQEFFFYGPDQPELRWESLAEWVPELDWPSARGLVIGQTGYGDAIVWVKGHRVHTDGCIAVFDHEVAMGDLPYFVIARSLSEFVAKVVHLKGLKPHGSMGDDLDDLDDDEQEEIDEDVLGMIDEELQGLESGTFGTESADLFDREYAELNPTSERGGQR